MKTLTVRGLIAGCILCTIFQPNGIDAAESTFKAGGKVVTPDREAVAAANHWLAKIDAGNYREAWDGFPTRIRHGGQTLEDQWVGFEKARRAPLGRPLSRSLFRARFSNTMSGAPDGNYEYLDYRTSFQHKKQAFESVTLTKESGHWQVSGYRCW